jgi:hypothetical protein
MEGQPQAPQGKSKRSIYIWLAVACVVVVAIIGIAVGVSGSFNNTGSSTVISDLPKGINVFPTSQPTPPPTSSPTTADKLLLIEACTFLSSLNAIAGIDFQKCLLETYAFLYSGDSIVSYHTHGGNAMVM